jgi:hypothetical protein
MDEELAADGYTHVEAIARDAACYGCFVASS